MIDDTFKNDENIKNPESDIIDVDLGFVEKKKFRFGKDDNRILELNTSDLNVTVRLNAYYPKLHDLFESAKEKIDAIPEDGENAELLAKLADTLESIDQEMRDLIDNIFGANVSEICAPSGNMFDPVDGQYRYERIIGIVTKLYANGLDAEFEKMKKRVAQKTSKYTGKQ